MKLRSVPQLDKRNKATSKSGDNAMSANCDAIAFFFIFGKFGAIQKPESGCIVCKT